MQQLSWPMRHPTDIQLSITLATQISDRLALLFIVAHGYSTSGPLPGPPMFPATNTCWQRLTWHVSCLYMHKNISPNGNYVIGQIISKKNNKCYVLCSLTNPIITCSSNNYYWSNLHMWTPFSSYKIVSHYWPINMYLL